MITLHCSDKNVYIDPKGLKLKVAIIVGEIKSTPHLHFSLMSEGQGPMLGLVF